MLEIFEKNINQATLLIVLNFEKKAIHHQCWLQHAMGLLVIYLNRLINIFKISALISKYG